MENKKELNEEKLTSLKDETVEDVAGGKFVEAGARVNEAAVSAEAMIFKLKKFR